MIIRREVKEGVKREMEEDENENEENEMIQIECQLK